MGEQITIGRLRISRQAAAVAGATALFVAISVWWLLYDKRTPGGGDPADHLRTTIIAADLLRGGDIGGLFEIGYDPRIDRFYPPLVPLVGSVAPLLGLVVQDWATVALNLVFVPMLAAGTYLAGRRIYNPTAGMLAAFFALGTPAVLSLFHVYLLDAPLAGTVAIAFAALIASERFAHRRASIAAGALIGLAMLVKTIALIYLAGPVAVMLIAGGWRRWQNLGLAALAGLLVAGPYYAIHLGDVLDVGQSTTTVGAGVGETGAFGERDATISFDNLTWYPWSAVNEQYFAPLLALFAVGLAASLRGLRSRPGIAEAIAAIAGTYLALTILLSIRDARYAVPLVAFVAILATGWIATSERRLLKRGGLAILAAAVALNVGASVLRDLPSVRLEPPSTNYRFGIDRGSITVLEDRGIWVGPPQPNPLWQRLFEAAEREQLETVRLFIREQPLFWGVDWKALEVFGIPYGVSEVTVDVAPPYPSADLRVSIWANDELFVGEKGLPEPCGTIEEGAGLLDGEPVATSVLVERRGPAGYERWCEF